jgi:hypothetical protein
MIHDPSTSQYVSWFLTMIQHLSCPALGHPGLFPDLNDAENIFIGHPLTDRSAVLITAPRPEEPANFWKPWDLPAIQWNGSVA